MDAGSGTILSLAGRILLARLKVREVGTMSATKIDHPSVEERHAEGEESRERMPPSRHGEWAPRADRFDPIALIEQQNETREPPTSCRCGTAG